MDDIEKRARELLAVEYERFDLPSTAAGARAGAYDLNPSMRAVVAALTPPEGYVLVPVETLEEVAGYADAFVNTHEFVRMTKERKMLHVRKAQEIIDAYHQEFANVND